ncbi:hypothetical protein SAMN05421743_107119 [Thalassobacillus cyri]|uniref:Uncharacterized protein n=1 Tax=Thalassobacillus cyri TaxID=571932 RepID=A0A1H4DGM9_9BACI|nr:hypothetical protein SAMN05421743_107119 [Thalassobacillus cyri]
MDSKQEKSHLYWSKKRLARIAYSIGPKRLLLNMKIRTKGLALKGDYSTVNKMKFQNIGRRIHEYVICYGIFTNNRVRELKTIG